MLRLVYRWQNAPARRRPRKAKPSTKGLDPAQCRLEQSEGTAAEAAEAVEKAGGYVVGQYKEPLGCHPTLVSILPIDKIEPTPFQRDLSDTHHKRLADVINKTGYFLDPLIAVLAPGGGWLLDAQPCAALALNPSRHQSSWNAKLHGRSWL